MFIPSLLQSTAHLSCTAADVILTLAEHD